MALKEYKAKRSFNSTPEPTGGKPAKNQLHFVIQKHAASRLHYDFRLEMEGVLKSWAVPKGPSMNPSDKRLAMLVEDHPYDYKNFEGIIPPGNYGAGTVIIWDEGTYEPMEDVKTKADKEKILLKGFREGQIKFRLNGQKLKGEFVLVRTPKRADNAWLLIKHRDQWATDADITEADLSVVSGKSLEDVAGDRSSDRWQSNRKASTPAAKKTTKRIVTAPRAKRSPLKRKRTSSQDNEVENDNTVLRKSGRSKKVKTGIPRDIKPMLATLTDRAVDEQGWLYEVKWDGYRAIAYLQGGEVDIRSRNNKRFNEKFYPVFDALASLKINAVLDGEIVVINDKGLPDFSALQTWRSEADGELLYYIFDILWLDEVSLMDVPLAERKKVLQQLIPQHDIIRLSESFDISATELYKLTDKMGLEGIVAKKMDSRYMPDVRTKEWLKIKTQKHQEAVIAGYTRNENSSRKISALLLGVYEGKELVFIGPVGSGFSAATQDEILKRLKPLETSRCPFRDEPDYNKPSRFRPDPPKAEVTWVRPKTVVEITYRTTAGDGSLRHPSFRGFRDDIDPQTVLRQEALPIPMINEHETTMLHGKAIKKPARSGRKTLLNPTEETQVREIQRHALKFTNLSKIFWPEDNVSKRDMLNYYYQVAPFIIPYMKDRPQTLNRFPNGIYGKSFYQKDVTGKVPAWIAKHEYYSEGDQRVKNFLVCTDEASLLYIASLGCVEMNPWSSRTQSPDNPDWCIIDLDPDKNPFDQVIETARVTHEVLEAIGVKSYCKTSGSTGLHIYIPLGAKYSFEESKEFGRVIAKAVHLQLPRFTSIERLTSNRKGKIYIDFLQNRPQATVAGPYSLRPKPGAPVSMPLHWEEVKKGLKLSDFNIRNAVGRLNEHGDLFEGVLKKGIDRQKAVGKIEEIFQVKDLFE